MMRRFVQVIGHDVDVVDIRIHTLDVDVAVAACDGRLVGAVARVGNGVFVAERFAQLLDELHIVFRVAGNVTCGAAPREARKLPVEVDPVDAPFLHEGNAVVREALHVIGALAQGREAAALLVVGVRDAVCETQADFQLRIALLEIDDVLETALTALQVEFLVDAVHHVEFGKGIIDMGQHGGVRYQRAVIGDIGRDVPSVVDAVVECDNRLLDRRIDDRNGLFAYPVISLAGSGQEGRQHQNHPPPIPHRANKVCAVP